MIDKKKNLTKVAARRKNLKELGEWDERIKEMGHENEEKGIKAVREVQKIDEIKQDKEKNDALEILTTKRKHKDSDYFASLCGWGGVVLNGISIPHGYQVTLKYSKEGVVVWIRSPKGAYYARGIKPSMNPLFDMRAVEDKVMEAIDFIDVLGNPEGKNGEKNGRNGRIITARK